MFEKSRFRYSRNRDARFEVPSKELIKEGPRKDDWVQGWLASAPPLSAGLLAGPTGNSPPKTGSRANRPWRAPRLRPSSTRFPARTAWPPTTHSVVSIPSSPTHSSCTARPAHPPLVGRKAVTVAAGRCHFVATQPWSLRGAGAVGAGQV